MNQIKAIGFDLFNTLITAEPGALRDALTSLTGCLAQTGLCPEYEQFKKAYWEAALGFIKRANKEGKETILYLTLFVSNSSANICFPPGSLWLKFLTKCTLYCS